MKHKLELEVSASERMKKKKNEENKIEWKVIEKELNEEITCFH